MADARVDGGFNAAILIHDPAHKTQAYHAQMVLRFRLKLLVLRSDYVFTVCLLVMHRPVHVLYRRTNVICTGLRDAATLQSNICVGRDETQIQAPQQLLGFWYK